MSSPAGVSGPPLVGRDREQAALRDQLAAALAGRGALVLIGGEAGIGKTALAEWLLAEATTQGALVLVGRCYDLTETPPYGPWRELFERAPRGAGLPDLPAVALPPESDGEMLAGQDAVFRRVRAYLAALAARRPVALLLDDLHWADPASTDLLRFLARSLAGMPLLILATYRADEVGHAHPLATLLPILVREARAARLDLRPLDTAAIGALVAARYALAAPEQDQLVGYLAARTEGNALFVGELLRTLESEGLLRQDSTQWQVGNLAAAPVPALLGQVIAGRLNRLAPETHRLLAIAAVTGQEVPLAAWAAVGDITEVDLLDHCERATAARLLVEASDGLAVRFPHALIREAVYEGISPIRRRALHRRAGEALAAGQHPDPDAVANHFQRAGDPRAVEWLVRAGLRASIQFAQLTAAARLVAAAALLAEVASRAGERGWMLYVSANMLLYTDIARALSLLDEADRLAPLAGDRALAANARYLRGHQYFHRGQVRVGLAAVAEGVAGLENLRGDDARWSGHQLALARIGALLPEGERVALQATTQSRPLPAAAHQRGELAKLCGYAGRYREALTLGEATVNAVLADDPGRRYVPGYFGLGHAYGALGRPAEARHAYAHWRAHLYAGNVMYEVAYTLFDELQHAVLPYQADDLSARAQLVTEEEHAWAGRQGTVATPYPAQAALQVALLEGRWEDARRRATAEVASSMPGHAQAAGAALGMLARWQGDPELAWARVRVLHPAGPETAPGDCLFIPGITLQALAADLALDAGDLATAVRWVAAHGRWLDWSGAVLWRAEHRLLQARLARASGDPAMADAHAEAAFAHASEPRQPLALLAAHRALGELRTAAGASAEADAYLEAALALADACAAPYERALALLALAELRAAEGRPGDATIPLSEARATFAALGAAPALARADALAANLAAPAPAPPAADLLFGLTAREAEVLRLVAEGLTDAQIGDRLFVSRHTINAHLRGIYGKLGVTSRAAATRLALTHGLA